MHKAQQMRLNSIFFIVDEKQQNSEVRELVHAPVAQRTSAAGSMASTMVRAPTFAPPISIIARMPSSSAAGAADLRRGVPGHCKRTLHIYDGV